MKRHTDRHGLSNSPLAFHPSSLRTTGPWGSPCRPLYAHLYVLGYHWSAAAATVRSARQSKCMSHLGHLLDYQCHAQ